MEWVEIHMKNTIMLWDIGLDESSGMMDIVATIGYKRVQDYSMIGRNLFWQSIVCNGFVGCFH
jgi:hypothetical protein